MQKNNDMKSSKTYQTLRASINALASSMTKPIRSDWNVSISRTTKAELALSPAQRMKLMEGATPKQNF